MMGGFGIVGILGGILMLLFTVGIGALVIFGIVWLVRNVAQGVQPGGAVSSLAPMRPMTVETCDSCGRTVQRDWKHCAHCGSPLA
jgi:hypothetical protein